jgi:protein Mpv17
MLQVFLSALAVQRMAAPVLSFQVLPLVQRPHQASPQLQAVSDSALLSDIDVLWRTYPYTAAALVCGFKASAADIIAQVKEESGDEENEDEPKINNKVLEATAVEKDEEEAPTFSFLSNTDWRRNGAFIAYGALYQGITQEFFYNHMYPIWFGTGTGMETVLTKVAFTLLVQTTVLTLPTLYASKALIEGFSLKEAAQQYIYDIQYQGLLQKFYVLWGPVLCLTFSVIPEQYRVTFIALISFFWLIILSSISSQEREAID